MDQPYVDYDRDFDELIKVTIEIGNKLENQKIPQGDWVIYLEGFGQKVLRHVLSARFLSKGYNLEIGNIRYAKTLDFGSVMVLTRTALETYLSFHYLFVDSKDSVEKRFRFLCWHISVFLIVPNMSRISTCIKN